MNIMEYIETNVAKDLSGSDHLLNKIAKASDYYNTIAGSLKENKVIDFTAGNENVKELSAEEFSNLKKDMKGRERETLPSEPEENQNYESEVFNNIQNESIIVNEENER